MFEKKEIDLGRLMQAITIVSNEIDLEQNLDNPDINGCMAPIFCKRDKYYALEKINLNSNIAVYIMEYNRDLSYYEIDRKVINYYELGIIICNKGEKIGQYFGYLSPLKNQELYRDWEMIESYFHRSSSRRTVNTINNWSQEIVQNKEELLQNKCVENKAYIKRKWYQK